MDFSCTRSRGSYKTTQSSTANGHGHADPATQHILRRLERIEKRLRALERDKKSSVTAARYESFSQKVGEHVSIIGIKEVISAKHHGIKILWLMFFFVCISAMSFFVFKTCREYLNEPTATKVKLVEQKQYDYPTILLCPDTWLDAEKVFNDGLTLPGLQYALGFLINYFANPPPYRIDDYAKAQAEFETYYYRRNFRDLVHFFKFIALDSREFFYHCPFCRNQSFEKVIMSDTVCYQVPMHSTPGNAPVVSSLDTLDVVVPDRTRGLLRRRSYWRLFLGLDLLLGEATRRHAEIYPHQTNTIQFVTHRFVSVNTPENPCLKPSEAPANYSYARCVLQCYTERYGEVLFLMTACSQPTTDCENERLQPNVTFQFYTEDLWEQLATNQESGKGEEAPEYCYTRCPSFCERMIYTMGVQSHSISPVMDLTMSGSRPNPNSTVPGFDKPKSRGIATPVNLTRISFLNSAAVYGGVLTFEEVSTYSFETMVGNVGGMLSLWMGVSIMSLIQMLMFLLTSWFKRRRMSPLCRRGSACGDSTVSPAIAGNSPICGLQYHSSGERSSIV